MPTNGKEGTGVGMGEGTTKGSSTSRTSTKGSTTEGGVKREAQFDDKGCNLPKLNRVESSFARKSEL